MSDVLAAFDISLSVFVHAVFIFDWLEYVFVHEGVQMRLVCMLSTSNVQSW